MTSTKILHAGIRATYINLISDFLKSQGEEVLVTESNELSMPCVDSEGNDEFLVLTFKVPTGSRDGEPYDGYAKAEDYSRTLANNAAKKKAAEESTAKKIAADKAAREAKAKIKAKRAAK